MNAGPHVYVDADACPVKAEVVKVAGRPGLPVVLVANAWMSVPRGPRVRLQVVAGSFDAADDWIVGAARRDDVVVTADIPLAARCLKLGARVLGPSGKPFTDDNIGNAMAQRELMADLRAYGAWSCITRRTSFFCPCLRLRRVVWSWTFICLACPGLDLQDRLGAQGACVPLIFVTAYDTPQAREHASSPGTFGLLLKPFKKEDLLDSIQAAVNWQAHATAWEVRRSGSVPP